MKVKHTACVCGLILSLFSVQIFAQGAIGWLKPATDKVIADLGVAQKNGSLGKPGVLSGIVQKDILPHVDMETVSRSVVGATCWNTASAADRAHFKRLFVRRVINTYKAPLEDFNGDIVKFSGGSDNYVKSQIIRKNGQVTELDYRVQGNKIVDIIVEDISMVNSYQSQFDCKDLRTLNSQLMSR